MNYSKIQEEIIHTSASKVCVVSSAASGKTTVLVGRLQHLIEQGEDPSKIVAITFTNAAAAEINERLNKPRGMFIGTVHSYANYLLISSGVETSDILDKEQFDKLFLRIKKHPESIRPVSYLLLDEAQDSTPQQFEFLLKCVNPLSWFLVGDWRQCIYSWSGADAQQLLDLSAREDVTVYNLNENYRNAKEILNYGKNIIRLAGSDYLDDSIPMVTTSGKIIDTEYEPVSLARYIKKIGNYKDWFVLTRTNAQIDEFSRYLTKEGVPFETFKRAQLDNDQLNKKLKDDTVKILTIHTSKGLEADNVAVIGARFYNLEEKCISYVAATRAKQLLVWTRVPTKPRRRQMTRNWEQ